MDKYKIAFIYGKADLNRNIKEGQIEKYGDLDDDSYHIIYLLEYIKEKQFNDNIFSKLNPSHLPEVVSYLISRMGHIVFLNTTKNESKYGKSGMFIIPSDISQITEDSLFIFADIIKDFSVRILYDLNLSSGFLDGDELIPSSKENPRTMLERYFEKIKKEKQH